MDDENLLQKLISIVLPLSILIPITCFIPDNIGLIISAIASVAVSPVIDKKISEYHKKQDKMHIKEQHYLQQLKIGLAEMDKKGTRINNMTPFFTDMISKKSEEHKIILDDCDIQNINQFLYMINANYYELIVNSYKVNTDRFKTREDVLREILESILRNMETRENYSFDDTNVPEVLATCLFIKEEVKKEIISEFKNSKVPSVLGKSRYIIERKDIKIENIEKEYDKKYSEVNKDDLSFDIYEKDSYKIVIDKISEMDHYKELGNVDNLTWNIDALMDICISIIDKYNSDMERNIDKYSIARFAVRLILITTSYALVNKKTYIGYKEIINAFTKIPNIPIELQMNIANFLTEKYESKMNEKQEQKILVFNRNYKINQN